MYLSVENELRYDCEYKKLVKVSSALYVPTVIYSQIRIQSRIMRLEILNQTLSSCCIHLWWLCGIQLLICFLLCLYPWYRDKLQDLLQTCRRISIEIFTFQDQKLRSRKQVHPYLELLDIDAPAEIREMAMLIAYIVFVACQFFGLFADAFLLAVNSLLKGGQFLMTSGSLVIIM